MLWAEKEAVETTETDSQTDALQAPPVPWNAGTYLHAELRPYQEKGVEWMLSLLEQGNGVCLGGDMGLGFFIAKTLIERTGGRIATRNRTAPPSGAVVQALWPLRALEADKLD